MDKKQSRRKILRQLLVTLCAIIAWSLFFWQVWHYCSLETYFFIDGLRLLTSFAVAALWSVILVRE